MVKLEDDGLVNRRGKSLLASHMDFSERGTTNSDFGIKTVPEESDNKLSMTDEAPRKASLIVFIESVVAVVAMKADELAKVPESTNAVTKIIDSAKQQPAGLMLF